MQKATAYNNLLFCAVSMAEIFANSDINLIQNYTHRISTDNLHIKQFKTFLQKKRKDVHTRHSKADHLTYSSPILVANLHP